MRVKGGRGEERRNGRQKKGGNSEGNRERGGGRDSERKRGNGRVRE